MAEDKNQPDVQRFEEEIYDVTCCLQRIFCGEVKLTLGPDEAEMNRHCLCGTCTSNKRGPYGELGTVDSSQWLCFYGFRAASLMEDPDDMKCIGFGCERASVDKIVAELKLRQGGRGDRAKVRMAETTLAQLDLLHKKVDALMEKMEVQPVAEEMERK